MCQKKEINYRYPVDPKKIIHQRKIKKGNNNLTINNDESDKNIEKQNKIS